MKENLSTGQVWQQGTENISVENQYTENISVWHRDTEMVPVGHQNREHHLENVPIVNQDTEKASVGHQDTEKMSVGHQDTEKASVGMLVGHQDTEKTSVGHQDTEKTSDGHQDTEKMSIGHQDTEKTSDGHQDTERTPDGHQDTEKTSDGHQDTEKLSVGHQDTEKTSLGHQNTEKTSVGHQDTEKISVGHQDTEKMSVGHQDTDKMSVGHQDTDKMSVGHQNTEKMSVGHQDTEKISVRHQDTEKTSVGHQDIEKTLIGHQDTEKMSVGHQDTVNMSVGHQDTEKTSVGHQDTEKMSVGHQDTEKTSVGHQDTEKASDEHQDTEKMSIGHQDTEKMSVGHHDTEKMSVGHQDTEKMSVGHQDTEKTSDEHQDTEKMSIGHQDTEKTTFGHQDTDKVSVGHENVLAQHEDISKGYQDSVNNQHQATEKMSVGHQDTEKMSVGHQDTEKVSVGHQDPEKMSVGHQDTEKMSVGHQDTEKTSDGHQDTEKMSVGHQDPEKMSVGHQDTEKMSVGHQDTEKTSDGHQDTDKMSKEHQNTEKVSVEHENVLAEHKDISEGYQDSVNNQHLEGVSVKHKDTESVSVGHQDAENVVEATTPYMYQSEEEEERSPGVEMMSEDSEYELSSDNASDSVDEEDCVIHQGELHGLTGISTVSQDDTTSTKKTTEEGPVAETSVSPGGLNHLYKQFEKVSIPIYRANGEKRNYEKIDHCFFCCHTFKSKISKHYENIHVDEDAVRRILLMPLGSKKRRTAWMKLQNEGNFKHNLKVIKAGEGELVISRRPNDKSESKYTSKDYLPCEFCLAFFRKDCLWAHATKCTLQSGVDRSEKNCVRNGLVLLAPFLHEVSQDEEELNNIFFQMKETYRNPGMKKVCENDTLIREFAKCLLDKIGSEKEQRRKDKDNIRTKLRTVGRLLQHLNENKYEPKPIEYYFTGPLFSSVVQGVKQLAVQADSPNLALRLGNYVRQLCLLKISLSIQLDDQNMRKEGHDFKELYEALWNSKVSCIANRRQKLRKINKTTPIPKTADLVCLKNYLQESIKIAVKNLNPTREQWKKTAQQILVRIVTFNKRRISEVEELKMQDYQNRPTDEGLQEIIDSLDVAEKALAERMALIEVRGKSTRSIRKVFILLTEDMREGIDWLIQHRELVGVSTSQYVFARPTSTPIDGCKAMRDVTSECKGLENPKSIRSSKLRTYLGTTAQILDMTGAELKMLADHMGHTVDIHMNVYRMQSAILERSKVARVLIAMDNGTIHNFRGRHLEDIQEKDLPVPVDYSDDWSRAESRNTTEETNFNNDSGDTDTEEPVTRKEDLPESRNQKAKVHKHTKAPWTATENRSFKQAFHGPLQNKRNVSAVEIRKAQESFPELKKRSISLIRSRVNNIIMGKIKKFML